MPDASVSGCVHDRAVVCDLCEAEERAWRETAAATRRVFLEVRDLLRPAGLVMFAVSAVGDPTVPLSYVYSEITPDTLCVVLVVSTRQVVHGPVTVPAACEWVARSVAGRR